MQNELEFKYPEKYLKWSKRYEISRKIKKEEYIKRNIDRERKSVRIGLIFILIVYLLILAGLMLFIYLLRVNNNYYHAELTNKDNLINDVSSKVCQDKNMTFYKMEYDNAKIYVNCNKEVIIFDKK